MHRAFGATRYSKDENKNIGIILRDSAGMILRNSHVTDNSLNKPAVTYPLLGADVATSPKGMHPIVR